MTDVSEVSGESTAGLSSRPKGPERGRTGGWTGFLLWLEVGPGEALCCLNLLQVPKQRLCYQLAQMRAQGE